MANSESSDLIENAFREAIKDHEFFEEGDILGDWLIIGHVVNPENTTHGYPMIFSNGSIATHSARGLLQTGLTMMGVSDGE